MRGSFRTAWSRAAALLVGIGLLFASVAYAQTTERQIVSMATATADGGLIVVQSNIIWTRTVVPTPHLTVALDAGPSHALYFALVAPACNADPDVIEQVTIILRAMPSGFSQQLLAIETAANSGVFRIRSATSTTPAAVGFKMAQPGDEITISYAGCGNVDVTSAVLTNPGGTVFDAATNAPVAGATVSLIDVTGDGNGGKAGGLAAVYAFDTLTPLPNPVVTGADGHYVFPLLGPSTYRLDVKPPTTAYGYPSALAPAAASAVYKPVAPGSYNGTFLVDAGLVAAYDLPLDRALMPGLSTQITASRSSAEIAETVEYLVTVRNTGQVAFTNVELDGSLPLGFAYLVGSARLEGGFTLAPPTNLGGPNPVFQLGPMGVGETRVLHLRVRLGAGAMNSDGVARAQARAAQPIAATSNTASVKVKVEAGVFSDKAMVLGTVFADCNANGVQDPGEPGAPGVRLYLEDGTFVVTDGAGRFSFYGVSPRTHVLKLDASSLPNGAETVAISQRHGGDGDSRFVDVQRGELHRADFALRGCSEALSKQLQARRAAQGEREIGTSLKTELKAGPVTSLGDLRALPAQGLVGERTAAATGAIGAVGAPTGASAAASASAATVAPASFASASSLAAPTTPPASITESAVATRSSAPPAPIDLETLAANADNQLAFIDLHEGDTVGRLPRSLRVKGRLGAVIGLSINGVPQGADRIGRTVRADDKQAEWREYIGVTLQPGHNLLTLTESDPFGHVRAGRAIHVVVPGDLAKLVVTPAVTRADADGDTKVAVRVEAFDAQGLAITDRLAITLQTSTGLWNERDLDARQPGVQTFIEGPSASVELIAPGAPGDADLVVSAGGGASVVKGEAKVSFGPVLRPMMAVGIIEGALNLRHLSAGAVQPANGSDGFEQQLRQYAGGADSGAGARAALFLKGKVRGDYLLTLGYDSDKARQDGLFRDIQPDAFYPVYGDSSVRGFDAQSTGKLYVRIEKDKSYFLYGDFTTQSQNPARQLGAYQRSLSGIKEHYEVGGVQLNAFASRDSSVQTIDELRADGTSGPFTLRGAEIVANSEKVEILVRDRNQPALIVKTTPLARFTDYDIDALTGRLLLHAPVASLDADLNPISIRITYEVDQGGAKFFVGGVDGQLTVIDGFDIGGSFVDDRNPLDPFRLESLNTTVKLGEKTRLIAEAARVDKAIEGSGDAERVELLHEGEALKARVYASRSDVGFDNPSSTLTKGRSESGAKAALTLDERTRLTGEALHTGDITTEARRDGALVGIERSFDGGTKLEVGARRVHDVPATADQPTTDTTSVRTKLTTTVPGIAAATVFGEAEQDVRDSNKRLVAVGGDYRLADGGRLYARHELISSLSGPYALDPAQRRNSTVLGIDADYMQDGRVFSEYRGREGFDGRSTEAALGLRNRWTLAEGLRLNTSVERVQTLTGIGTGTTAAATGAVEYTANPLWKGTARLEARDGTTSRSGLSTLGIARKLDADWTFLGKNIFSVTQDKPAAGVAAQPLRVQERLQLGIAYRDSATNRSNALARYEFKQERGGLGDAGTRDVHIVSTHADYQPIRMLTLTGHVAAKWVTESVDGLPTRGNAQLVGGRATIDLGGKWDAGVAANVLATGSFTSRQTGLGGELGYMAAKNTWVSVGYNVSGFKDRDLSAENYTSRGVYVRLRFKFDENLFGKAAS